MVKHTRVPKGKEKMGESNISLEYTEEEKKYFKEKSEEFPDETENTILFHEQKRDLNDKTIERITLEELFRFMTGEEYPKINNLKDEKE